MTPPGSVPRKGTLPTHPNFRAIVLANRPGFPFLGNDFFRECGDVLSTHVVEAPSVWLPPQRGHFGAVAMHFFAGARRVKPFSIDQSNHCLPRLPQNLLSSVRSVRTCPSPC